MEGSVGLQAKQKFFLDLRNQPLSFASLSLGEGAFWKLLLKILQPWLNTSQQGPKTDVTGPALSQLKSQETQPNPGLGSSAATRSVSTLATPSEKLDVA